MVFSSHIFLFGFLVVALLAYYATPMRWRALTLTFFSYLFYGWWNPWFVILMLVSTVIDYQCGKLITKPGKTAAGRNAGLWLSVISNLGILGFFKYSLFFAETVSWMGAWLGLGAIEMPAFLSQVILPVGISFYTFQSMSYSIDLYRGHAKPADGFVNFACYVSLFPQLVAGPIVRYGSVADQLRSREHTLEGFVSGMTRFQFGFAKKILLANPMGSIADLCFDSGEPALTCSLAWIGALAYAFQIYFDFSGYSDMAIGLGKMIGFRFPENFDSPYRSRSITEFWRRWHISLSSFLRDYLYIPLGGNRRGAGRTYINLMLVMLIGGLWHGAQWTFVIWGGIHGVCLALERWGRNRNLLRLPEFPALVVSFAVILITWVFFRSDSFTDAIRYLAIMFGQGIETSSSHVLEAVVLRPYHLVALLVCSVVIWAAPVSQMFLHRITTWKIALGFVLLFASVRTMSFEGFNPFLYFQF